MAGRVVAIAALLLLSADRRPAEASGIISGQCSVDLRDPAETPQKVRWAHADRVRVGAAGLGWEGSPGDILDESWIETTEPIGVGTSWYAARGLSVTATAAWSGVEKVIFVGRMFIRHSSDAVHWTDWIAMSPSRGSDASASADPSTFECHLDLPHRDSTPYWERRRAMQKAGGVRTTGDEEEAVRAILAAEPEFFATNRPFIGWIQLLWEGEFRSGARLASIDVKWSAVFPGGWAPPEPSRSGPWRFRATRR